MRTGMEYERRIRGRLVHSVKARSDSQLRLEVADHHLEQEQPGRHIAHPVALHVYGRTANHARKTTE